MDDDSELHADVAAELKGTRKLRQMSIAKLSKISKVSRRHIHVAEMGGNITLSVLKRLMRGLQMSHISLGDLMSATGSIDGIRPEVIAVIADEMDAGLRLLTHAAASLRAYAEGRSAPDMNAKAAALIREITRDAKSANATKKVEQALQDAVSDRVRR